MIKQPTRKANFKSSSTSGKSTSDAEQNQRKSRLETYVEVLDKLVRSKQGNIIDAVTDVPEYYIKALDFLVEQGLIRKRKLGRATAYSTTRRGLCVLKYFSLIKTMPKITYNKQ